MKYQIIKNKSFIKVSGNDALSFLQGIMSADIKSKGQVYSLMLNPQGRYLSDFFIINHQDSFLLEMPSSHKDQILAKLKMYKLRSDVIIYDLSNQYFVIFSDAALDGDSTISYQDPRTHNYFRNIIPKEYEQKFLQNDSEFYQELKYRKPILDGYDMVYEKSIPIEYGMENFNAISFTKGCYIGQEIISRAKHTGVVRKRIYVLESKNSDINAKQDDEVLINGEKMGRICSVWRDKAIALMKEGADQTAEWRVSGMKVFCLNL
jgi:folate-binding protein YgfZ